METGLWNKLDLKPPPTLTVQLTTGQVSFTNLRKLSDVLWDALTVLQNQDALYTEAATLSRLIYRMKSMFRGDKGFKSIEKINHCLRHFLSLNLVPIYDNFFRTIPWNCSGKEIYCPTRQMLEHILVRTQGLVALLCRIVHTCMETAFFFKTRMSSGHNWQVSLLCLGVVSRIWALSKHILASAVKWFSTMLPFLDIFQAKGPIWLPQDYVFPSDLTNWLCMPWMQSSLTLSECQVNAPETISNDSFPASMNDVESPHYITPKVQSIHDDVGVSVSRSFYSALVTPTEEEIVPPHAVELRNSEENLEDSNTATVEISKQVKSSKKGKKRRKLAVPEVEQDTVYPGRQESSTIMEGGSQSVFPRRSKGKLSVPEIDKKEAKVKNISKVISSINSESDVQSLLVREAKQRSLTRSLDDEQWMLLKSLVEKLNCKLKNAKGESKRNQIVDQIRKAFRIALS